LMAPGAFMYVTIPNPKEYLQSRPDLDVSRIDLTVEQALLVPFRIRNHAPHPERVIFFHRPLRTYSYTATSTGLTIADFDIPHRIGIGRAHDIAVLVFEKPES
jgi:hypothetical protein